MQTMGKGSATDVEVQEYIFKGAMDQVGSKQESCMSVAGENTTLIEECKVFAQGHLAKALGKRAADVDKTDVASFARKAMFGKVQEAVQGCVSSINETYSQEVQLAEKKTCVEEIAATAIARALGKRNATITKMQLSRHIEDSAANGAVLKNKACVAAATDKTERLQCKESTKEGIKAMKGGTKNSTDNEFDRMIRKGSGDELANLAKACVETEATTCDFAAGKAAFNGPKSDDPVKTAPNTKTTAAKKEKYEEQSSKKEAKQALIRSERRACRESLSEDDDVTKCVLDKVVTTGYVQRCGSSSDDAKKRLAADIEKDAEDEVHDDFRACIGAGEDGSECKKKVLDALKTSDPSQFAGSLVPTVEVTSDEEKTIVKCQNPPCKKNVMRSSFFNDTLKTGGAKARKSANDCTMRGYADAKTQETAASECNKEADTDAKASFGREEKDKKGDEKLSSLMTAASKQVDCLDASGTKEECEDYSKEEFIKAAGGKDFSKATGGSTTVSADKTAMLEEEWTKVKSNVTDVVKGMRAGASQMLKKEKKADLEVEFPVACSQIADAATLVAVKANVVASLPTGEEAPEVESGTKYTPKTGSCAVKYEVKMKDDKSDESIETFTKNFAAKALTVGTTGGRRGSTSGESYASQGSTMCPSTGCGSGDTSTASDIVIKQSVEFTSLSTTADYDAVKTVIEVAYGIELGIYDTSTQDYKTGCGVESSIQTARRALTISFSADVASTLSAAASTQAGGLSSSSMTTALNSAQTSLGTSVTLPTVGTVGTAASTTTATTTGAAASSSDSDSGVPILIVFVALVLVSIVFFGCGYALYYYYCSDTPPPSVVPAKLEEVKIGFDDDQPPPGAVYMKNGTWLDSNDNPIYTSQRL